MDYNEHPPHSSSRYDINSKIMIAAVIVLFAVVLFVFLLHLYARWFWRYSARISHRRRQSSFLRRRFYFAQEEDPHVVGLDKAVLEALPMFVYTAENFKEGGKTAPENNHNTYSITPWSFLSSARHQATMLLTSLLAVVLASLARTTSAQGQTPINYDNIHNATVIYGTWSSGSKAVQTGSGFANPANMTFTYPKTTGISYSFSTDGFYEISRYRFNSNGSEPTCITGVIGWVHGTYSLNPNGSISMTPLGDGFQQVQDPCAAISNFVETYNLTEYYQSWRIFQDPTQGYKLHMFAFDGSPLAPMFQVSTTPNMLPTRLLRNVPAAPSVARREVSSAQDVVGSRWVTGVMAGVGLVLMTSTLILL